MILPNNLMWLVPSSGVDFLMEASFSSPMTKPGESTCQNQTSGKCSVLWIQQVQFSANKLGGQRGCPRRKNMPIMQRISRYDPVMLNIEQHEALSKARGRLDAIGGHL